MIKTRFASLAEAVLSFFSPLPVVSRGSDGCVQPGLPSKRIQRAHAKEWRPSATKPTAMKPVRLAQKE
jgi:hypothetical protein